MDGYERSSAVCTVTIIIIDTINAHFLCPWYLNSDAIKVSINQSMRSLQIFFFRIFMQFILTLILLLLCRLLSVEITDAIRTDVDTTLLCVAQTALALCLRYL